MNDTPMEEYIGRIFSISGKEDPEKEFCALALEAFEIQREHCPVYRQYLELTGKGDFHPESIEQIPFLPIRLFKSRNILTHIIGAELESEESPPLLENGRIFTSSATTGMVPSKHIVSDISVYERSFREGFRRFYGESGSYNLLALLPSYLEREGSSLVYMADRLIEDARAHGAEGRFFLYNHDELLNTLLHISKSDSSGEDVIGKDLLTQKRKTILLGVSFALIDFAEYVKNQLPEPEERLKIFSGVVTMETGGMKGRGRELSRKELHSILNDAFQGSPIHSEYGMCELLSQAYSISETISENGSSEIDSGLFITPPWMRVMTRDLQDPFRILPAPLPNNGKASGRKSCNTEKEYAAGGLNIIDLANIYSCCFIETEDVGRIFSEDQIHPVFTVDGRIKDAERRGCNMLIE